MTKYVGGCHCGAVRFEAEADIEKLLDCNCSHCHKKGFLLAFIPKDQFTVTSGRDMLTEYYFNKKSIRHLFCKVCGVQAFAEGVTDPYVAINAHCIDDFDTSSVPTEEFNGKDI